MSDPDIWVLADPRAGTAAQALGIAERLGEPFRTVPLAFGRWAALPWPWPTLAGLTAASRLAFQPPWPRLVISAGRRAAPIALWLGARGVRTVHAMRPGFGAARFDLLVLGQHDAPAAAQNVLPILGATHRVSPARLADARAAFPEFAALPSPRVALLVGGTVHGAPLSPAFAKTLGSQAAAFGGSVLATTSRRTGDAATIALAQALAPHPHRLHRFGDSGPNPYAAMLGWADAVIVTGDSVSMVSEALATAAPVFVADPGGLPRRHAALLMALEAVGQTKPAGAVATSFKRTPLDETGRVAAAILATLLGGEKRAPCFIGPATQGRDSRD